MVRDIKDDSIKRIKKIMDSEANEIARTANNLNPLELQQVLYILKKCQGKIITTGCGTSGTAAKKIAHTFNCTGLSAFFLSPAEALHGGMGAIDKEDVVIFISKGGHSSELDLMIESVIKKGAVTIIVTENKNSVLAQKGSQTLLVKVEKEPDQFNMLATASTLAVISTFDAITIELSEERNYTQEEFLVIHPGGKVGEQLAEQFSD
ncbi:MAG: SIS domain-containing protein [Blautia sp.]